MNTHVERSPFFDSIREIEDLRGALYSCEISGSGTNAPLDVNGPTDTKACVTLVSKGDNHEET